MSTYISGPAAIGHQPMTPACTAGSRSEDGPMIHVVDSDPDRTVYRLATESSRASRYRIYRSVEEYLRVAGDDRSVGLLLIALRVDPQHDLRLLRDGLARRIIDRPVIVTAARMDFEPAVALMEHGALTVLRRPVAPATLAQYVNTAIEEDRTCRELSQTYLRLRETLRGLTERQRRILELADEGLPNKAIASQLDVSIRTVEVDRAKVLRAFKARSLAGVTRQLGQLRMLSLWQSHWRFSRPCLGIDREHLASDGATRKPR